MSGELLRGAASFFTALPFCLVPRGLRFRAVMAAASMLTPLVGPVLLRRYGNTVGSASDETLRVLCRAMVRLRVKYDVSVEADVDPELLPALRRGGTLLVSAHFPLNAFFVRWLYDRGHEVSAVRETPGRAFVWGTGTEIDILRPSHEVMLQMRTRLRAGRPLLLAIDRALPKTRPVDAATRFGLTRIATPPFALARKLGVPVFFYGVRAAKSGNPILTVRRIPPEPEAFAEHFRRHTELMLP